MLKTKTTVNSFLQKIQKNENLALRELYRDNYHKVETYILQNNGTPDMAKDIFQEAFLVVWQHIKSGRFKENSETAANGYLYQIARNKWIDYLRSAQYKKTIQLNTNDMDLMKDKELLADSEAEQDERLHRTTEAFKRLGEECKKMLLRFYFHKKSMREIAESIHIDEASARNKKYRCMERLRELTLKS